MSGKGILISFLLLMLVLAVGGLVCLIWPDRIVKLPMLAEVSRSLNLVSGSHLDAKTAPVTPPAKNLPEITYRAEQKDRVAYIQKIRKGKDYLYQIVIKSGNGAERIVDPGEPGRKWLDVKFSPTGFYLMALGQEGSNYYGEVFRVISGESVYDYLPGARKMGFTDDENFFYACGSAGNENPVLMTVNILPDFEERYRYQNKLNLDRNVKCSYDAENKRINFNYITQKDKPKETAASYSFSTLLK